MNEVLRTREQINVATKWLQDNGYVTHPISCKDFELKIITEALGDGDLLDMGADGSFILHNAIRKGIKGRKVGIDLIEVVGGNAADGAEYFKGDLMQCPFPDNSFDTIVSQSVIEHQVDLSMFAKECSRLLRDNGQVIVSFDYFEPKPNTENMKLYSLDWNILDTKDVLRLVDEFKNKGLELTSEIDWTIQDAVINPQYCSPVQGVSYTFLILNFIKNSL